MAIWMDLTFSMRTRKGKGIVGIVRAELEIAHYLHEINKDTRFFVVEKNGFHELNHNVIEEVIESENISKAYIEKWPIKKEKETIKSEVPDGLNHVYYFWGRYTRRAERVECILRILILKTPFLFRWIIHAIFGFLIFVLKRMVRIVDKINQWKEERKKHVDKKQSIECNPFDSSDVILSFGWYDNGDIDKEFAFSQLKTKMPKLKLIYMIYDLVFVNPETEALYPVKYEFGKYLNWISNNCDFVFFGGETAKKDSESYWKKNDLRIPDGKAVHFGSDCFAANHLDFDEYKKKKHIEDKFILAVGSIDIKKNYDVLYKAYSVFNQRGILEKCPQLIIVGGKINGKKTSDNIELTPRVKDKIIIIRASDDELNSLYENCLFTVLPTWYEGWSLTLPEALEHGKFCLGSDIAPLREIGGKLIEYVDPADPYLWADRIYELSNNVERIKEYEKAIKKYWKSPTWKETATTVSQAIADTMIDNRSKGANIIFDMTLTYCSVIINAPVSGILRTELTLMRYLCRIYPSMRLLAFTSDGPIFINRMAMGEVLGDRIIDDAFKNLGWYLNHYGYLNDSKMSQKQSTEDLYWLICSIMPSKIKQKMIDSGKASEKKKSSGAIELPFEEGDVFLSFGTALGNVPYNIYEMLSKKNRKCQFKFVQLLYDFTPILMPQFHHKSTRDTYRSYLINTYKTADFILYGGKTAENDGRNFALDNKLPTLPSAPVYFGGDKVGEDPNDKWSSNIEEEEEQEQLFKKLGIKGKYVLVVGSIEPRKNHESLYLAYLHMLKKFDDIPQMIFAGFYGWDMEEFVSRVQRDERVRQKIIFYTPSDKELDLLYRKCMFTVLASLYEGWSLTLPESLSRGKFCLCCDTPALKEIAGDLSDYVEGFDIKTWAEKIHYYYENEDALKAKEKAIKDNWHVITWRECAEQVASIIDEQMEA